jgi:hypothetical protein
MFLPYTFFHGSFLVISISNPAPPKNGLQRIIFPAVLHQPFRRGRWGERNDLYTVHIPVIY